jgi:hypothetical protein
MFSYGVSNYSTYLTQYHPFSSVSRSARAGDAAMFVSALASAQSNIKLLVGSHLWTTQSCGMQFKTFLDKRIKTHEPFFASI